MRDAEQQSKRLCVRPWQHKDVHNPTRMLMNRSDGGVSRGGGGRMMNHIRPPCLIFYLFFDRASEASMPSSIHYNPTFIMIDPPRNKSTGGRGDAGALRVLECDPARCYNPLLWVSISKALLFGWCRSQLAIDASAKWVNRWKVWITLLICIIQRPILHCYITITLKSQS